MSTDEIIDAENEAEEITGQEEVEIDAPAGHSAYKVPKISDEAVKHHLSGMYQNWFLDYASYVILERAVPDIYDGLKPVQRRILHSMKRLDDGRYNKVANIVGHTMQFHPHGDASIGDALVQLGQKDLLIDCQGNWGNILTGDGAAAPRYIEARLSKFALETVFNPKTTEWKASYDGRNKEPIALPVKFPLLLAQGVEGIAVGLNSKILPHNFNELLDACIAHLRDEEFILFPDFQTGGSIDVSRYNDGERGGAVKIRAKIGKIDNKNIKRQKTKKIVNTPIETLQVFFTAIQELYKNEPFYKSLYLFGIAQRRKSEILKLRWEDIDFNSNTYLCRDTKNGENQTFYLPPSIKNELLQFREIKGWVYGSPLDNSKHITNIEKQTTKVKEKVEAIYKKMIIENGVTNEEHIKLELAKKPKFTLHYFRNIGSSVLQQQGMESIISGALGHNNMNTKNLYTTIDYITSSKKYNEVIEANLTLINK